MRVRWTLRVRFAVLMAVAVASLGLVTRLYLNSRILDELENELELRAVSFARYLAAESVPLVLRHDLVGLQDLLDEAVRTAPDVVYAFVIDPTDAVLVHTFVAAFPQELTALNRYRERGGLQTSRIEVFGERYRDVAVPLHHGELGVLRLGVRDGRILDRVATVRREFTIVVLAIMVLSAGAAYGFTSSGLRPLATISAALERFSPGRYREAIVPHRDDEIGDLAMQVNQITARLHVSQAQLMQAEKMVAAGLMASGIAHEINNPISGLQNCLRRIQARPTDVAQIEEYTALMLQATEHIERVVRGLLEFSRTAPKQSRLLDFRGVLTTALSLSAFRLQKNQIDVQRRIPDRPLWVRGDEGQLVQVVVNVVLNAVDAMPAGGILRITLASRDGWADLGICDTGTGIGAEHLRQVFEPFFTTKGSGKGTGLGLAVTQGIVLDHEGHIEISSTPGQGTDVRISLPRRAEQEPTADVAT